MRMSKLCSLGCEPRCTKMHSNFYRMFFARPSLHWHRDGDHMIGLFLPNNRLELKLLFIVIEAVKGKP